MSAVTELFVVRLADEGEAARARRDARHAFLALDGVSDWRTLRSTSGDSPTLFVELFEFESAERAKAAGARFSTLPETARFLTLIEETLVGQHFVDITEKTAA